MPDYGSTDRVRLAAAEQYIEPARRRGETIVKIHSGVLNKALVARNLLAPARFPIVCDALRSAKFQRENGLELLEVQGPPTARSGRSSTLTFVYRLEPHIAPLVNAPSTIDSALFDSLRGIGRETYRKLGGAEAFHQAERDSWVNETNLLGHHDLHLLV